MLLGTTILIETFPCDLLAGLDMETQFYLLFARSNDH